MLYQHAIYLYKHHGLNTHSMVDRTRQGNRQRTRTRRLCIVESGQCNHGCEDGKVEDGSEGQVECG